jgi:hypothetical protein
MGTALLKNPCFIQLVPWTTPEVLTVPFSPVVCVTPYIHIYVLLEGLSQNSVISEAALWMQYQKCQKPQYVRLLWSIPN